MITNVLVVSKSHTELSSPRSATNMTSFTKKFLTNSVALWPFRWKNSRTKSRKLVASSRLWAWKSVTTWLSLWQRFKKWNVSSLSGKNSLKNADLARNSFKSRGTSGPQTGCGSTLWRANGQVSNKFCKNALPRWKSRFLCCKPKLCKRRIMFRRRSKRSNTSGKITDPKMLLANLSWPLPRSSSQSTNCLSSAL